MSGLVARSRRLLGRLPWRLIRFALVGGTSTVLYAGLAYVFTVTLRLQEVLASVIAYFLCTLFSYMAHRRITFRSVRPMAEEVPQFAGISIIGWSVAILSPWLMTTLGGLPPVVAIVFVSVAVPTLSFLGMERFVFRAGRTDVPGGRGVTGHVGSERHNDVGTARGE